MIGLGFKARQPASSTRHEERPQSVVSSADRPIRDAAGQDFSAPSAQAELAARQCCSSGCTPMRTRPMRSILQHTIKRDSSGESTVNDPNQTMRLPVVEARNVPNGIPPRKALPPKDTIIPPKDAAST